MPPPEKKRKGGGGKAGGEEGGIEGIDRGEESHKKIKEVYLFLSIYGDRDIVEVVIYVLLYYYSYKHENIDCNALPFHGQ